MKQEQRQSKLDISIRDMIPSGKALQGEIMVKGKTLGLWSTKKFILDPVPATLILRTQAEKSQQYDLRCYILDVQEKKKEKYRLRLEPTNTNEKRIQLGSSNEKLFIQVVTILREICNKKPEVTAPLNKQTTSVRKSILGIFNNEEVIEQLPPQFTTNDIINNQAEDFQDDFYIQEYESSCFEIKRHKQNPTQFKTIMTLNDDIAPHVLYNILTNFNIVQKWNKFVTPQSRVIRPISEESAILIQEQRIYFGLYPFPREYVYLRHTRYQNDKITIIDKSVDAIDVRPSFPKGQIRFAVWKITKEDKLKLTVVMDCSNAGFGFPDEDGFFTSHFLQELENLRSYISKNLETIQQDKILQKNPFEKTQFNKDESIQINKPLQNEPEPQDEAFFDCLDEQLHIESRESLIKELDEPLDDVGFKPPVDEMEWMNWKLKLFQTGEFHHYHLKNRFQMEADQKQDQTYNLLKLPEGVNFLFLDDWLRDDNKGGLKMINQMKIQAQKKVIKFLLLRIGSNLLTGKSLMRISMPVDIFEARSNTERICNALGFAPQFLERAAKSNDFVSRLQDCYAFSLGYMMNYMSMEKPFNPILGETYQGYLDRCPVYAEQVSHHPPITAFQLYGRGYKLEGRLETQANIHSNSVTGKNLGHITVKFSDQTVKIHLAPGQITGTAFGDRMFWYTGKSFCVDVENQLILEIINQPDKKMCNTLGIPYQPIGDYLVGGIFKVTPQGIARYIKDGYKKYNGLEKNDAKEILHRISGRWTKDVTVLSQLNHKIDQQIIFDVMTQIPCALQHEPYPLASDANYRQDLLWWKVRDFDKAQSFKEMMENLQRLDRNLREKKH